MGGMGGDCDTLYCLDCLEYTGCDERVIGYPSLSEESKPQLSGDEEFSSHGRVNFGFLRKGLTALKMNTESLESYTAFLKKHDGHNVRLDTGWCDEYNGCKRFEYGNENFVEAYYEIHCKTCKLTTRLERNEPVKILPFEEFEITKDIQTYFIKHAFYDSKFTDDLYVNYLYAFDLLLEMENIDALSSFLTEHSGHELVARLSND